MRAVSRLHAKIVDELLEGSSGNLCLRRVSRLPYGKAHDSLVVEHDADGHHHALLLTVEQLSSCWIKGGHKEWKRALVTSPFNRSRRPP
jgi:hypothetical protein